MSFTSRTPVSIRPVHDSSAGKRRQLRKGTFSCWECKRRKTRCEFKQKSAPTCVSCQRRGTSCVGQELIDPAENADIRVGERIFQVESLVNQLIQQRTQTPTSRKPNAIGTRIGNEERLGEALTESEYLNTGNSLNRPSSLLSTTDDVAPGSRSLSSRLHSTLPHPNKAALILTRGNFYILPIHIRGKVPRMIGSSVERSEQLLQVSELPSPTAHPVHFARKLVQLALCLHQLDKPVYDVAQRYVDIASRYVTSQDSLMDSIDGVETLALECCYYINVGDIRRAWLVVRRALAIAQLIGLHLATTETDCREARVWVRLVLGDRVLSWMLGKSLAVFDEESMIPHGLAAKEYSPNMERLHAAIFGRIISRNVLMQHRRRQLLHQRSSESYEKNLYDDLAATREIDQALKEAAQFLPANLWMSLTRIAGSVDADIMEKTEKLVAHLHHHFLLILLHQPYLIHTSCSARAAEGTVPTRTPFNETFSLNTVLCASRELLSRFVILRDFHRKLSYRALDDKAFVASTMLLLVYVSSHNLGTDSIFKHQRSYDLRLIDEVIDIIEQTSSANQDVLSTPMVKLLKALQTIEAQAAETKKYCIWMEEILDKQQSFESIEHSAGLSLLIPYFGTLHICPKESMELQLQSNQTSDLSSSSEFESGLSVSTRTDNAANTNVLHNHPVFPSFSASESSLDLDLYLDSSAQFVSPQVTQEMSPPHTAQAS